MTHYDEPTYTAFDGQAYVWPPPQGWQQDNMGRWWPPGEVPVAEYPGPFADPKARPPRSWWQKKRYLIPLGLFGGLVVVAALSSDPAEDTAAEDSAVEDSAVEDSATSDVSADGSTAETVGATTTTVQSLTESVAPPTEATTADLTESEIDEMASVLAFRLTATEVVPGIAALSDEELQEFGQSMCDVARQAGSAEELGAVLLLAWADMDQGTRDVFDNDSTNMAGVAGAALGAFCPEELERLGLS